MPPRCLSFSGDCITNPGKGSNWWEFGMHFNNWYLPPSFSCKNSWYKMSRKILAEAQESSNSFLNQLQIAHLFQPLLWELVDPYMQNMQTCASRHISFSWFCSCFLLTKYIATLLWQTIDCHCLDACSLDIAWSHLKSRSKKIKLVEQMYRVLFVLESFIVIWVDKFIRSRMCCCLTSYLCDPEN